MSAFADKLAALREKATPGECVYVRMEPTSTTTEFHEPYSPWVSRFPKGVQVGRVICIRADDMALIAHLVNHAAEIEALVRTAIHYIPYCDHYQCRICLAMARKNKEINHDPDCALAALEKKA